MKQKLNLLFTVFLLFSLGIAKVSASTMDKTFAYAAGGGPISICSVDSESHKLTMCSGRKPDQYATDIILNANGDMAYLSKPFDLRLGDGSISICRVNTDGSIANSCSTVPIKKLEGAEDYLPTISLNSDSSILYAGSNLGMIYACKINKDGSLVAPCPVANPDFRLNNSFGRLGIHPDGKHVYIPDSSLYSIVVCSINTKDGTFSDCKESARDRNIYNIHSAAVNPQGTFLYAANYNPQTNQSNILVCPIKQDGSLEKCSLSDCNKTLDFTHQSIINIFISNDLAYIPNDPQSSSRDDSSLSICSIRSDGSLEIAEIQKPFFSRTIWLTSRPNNKK